MKHTRTALILILTAAALILAATPAAAAPLQWWERAEEVTANIPLWWQLCPCKMGNCTTATPQTSTQATGTAEDTAEPIATPEPIHTPPAVPVCGQWAESGPHNCPQPASDTASPAPAPEPGQPGRNDK
jgi:hypothetical protein